jgi:hypothetical protein
MLQSLLGQVKDLTYVSPATRSKKNMATFVVRV